MRARPHSKLHDQPRAHGAGVQAPAGLQPSASSPRTPASAPHPAYLARMESCMDLVMKPTSMSPAPSPPSSCAPSVSPASTLRMTTCTAQRSSVVAAGEGGRGEAGERTDVCERRAASEGSSQCQEEAAQWSACLLSRPPFPPLPYPLVQSGPFFSPPLPSPCAVAPPLPSPPIALAWSAPASSSSTAWRRSAAQA